MKGLNPCSHISRLHRTLRTTYEVVREAHGFDINKHGYPRAKLELNLGLCERLSESVGLGLITISNHRHGFHKLLQGDD